MIIPVRCVTCGKVIGDKWRYYKAKVLAAGGADPLEDMAPECARLRKETMDELGLVRYCCRRHFMGHVDLIERL
jgi:DNA-directed RNA polymerase subunit N (RpoN/RPB10)